MQFGSHVPAEIKDRGVQSVMAAFSRGDQRPGTQWKFKFDNGFGASVINDGYGAERGLYELAVFDSDEHITYETPITSDVLGYLTETEVVEALDRVASLTQESVIQGQIDRENAERDERIASLRAELAVLEQAANK